MRNRWLVCSTGGFQQVRAVMKGSDVSSIHERLWQPVETKMLSSAYIEQATYWGCRLYCMQPPGCCIFLAKTRASIYSSTLRNNEKRNVDVFLKVRNSKMNVVSVKLEKLSQMQQKVQQVTETNNLLHRRERKTSFTDGFIMCRCWQVLQQQAVIGWWSLEQYFLTMSSGLS